MINGVLKSYTFVSMKISAFILLFYFIIGACIPQGDFSQLLKLNNLMKHYELHQEEARAIGKTVSFSSFLYIHFIDSDEHQHDGEEDHESLPFQNISSSTTFYLTSFQATAIPRPHFTEQLIPSTGSFVQEDISFDIFHPPITA